MWSIALLEYSSTPNRLPLIAYLSGVRQLAKSWLAFKLARITFLRSGKSILCTFAMVDKPKFPKAHLPQLSFFLISKNSFSFHFCFKTHHAVLGGKTLHTHEQIIISSRGRKSQDCQTFRTCVYNKSHPQESRSYAQHDISCLFKFFLAST